MIHIASFKIFSCLRWYHRCTCSGFLLRICELIAYSSETSRLLLFILSLQFPISLCFFLSLSYNGILSYIRLVLIVIPDVVSLYYVMNCSHFDELSMLCAFICNLTGNENILETFHEELNGFSWYVT